jgi:hypothetical protein
MSALIDNKYANLLSARLPKWKVKKYQPFLATARCIICGDSQSNPNKCRAYVYEKKGVYKYTCHNCGWSNQLWWFLKEYQPDLYTQYQLDAFGEKKMERIADPILTYSKPKFETSGVLKGLKRISQLNANHPAREYVNGRLIPTPAHARLYFVVNFYAWINQLIPDKFKNLPKIDPRLVIPLIDRKGNVFAVQGRALTAKQKERYITIRFDEEVPKLFGLDKVDPNGRIYITEGPIDSLFLPNAIAMAGADCSPDSILEYSGSTKDRLVFVFDNERHNKDIVGRMERLMKDGYNVCIWPKRTVHKDVNKMIQEGANAADIQLIIDNNIHSGMEGELHLVAWVSGI